MCGFAVLSIAMSLEILLSVYGLMGFSKVKKLSAVPIFLFNIAWRV